MPGLPLRGVVACQAVLLAGLLLVHPAIRRAVPPLVSAIALVVRGDLSRPSERLTPHGGEAALTPVPHELVIVARQQRLADFTMSARLTDQTEILQRATEGAWPIRFSARSPHLFVAKGEPLPPRCELRHAGQLVDYARCR